jgi:5-oxoprolinase (ATP-hydrolysing) subunit C
VVEGRRLTASAGLRVAAGTAVRLEPSTGARGYLAVSGGIRVGQVMGSASTDLRTGFGGLEGRALRAGDHLAVGTPAGPPGVWAGTIPDGPIRIVDGPHASPAAIEALIGAEWIVSLEADRTGVRLDGPRIGGSSEIASMGLPLGAIQLAPDGRPIVMLVDRPVTGGYPVPACVIGADIGRIAQLRPGDPLRLTTVSMDEARDARQAAERELDSVEPIDADGELGWAGSHR